MSITILYITTWREGGMQTMFKHIFASMKEKLNEIMIDYPHANEDQKKLHDEQLSVLKQFSDAFIEEWLQFEEIMADFREHQLAPSNSSSTVLGMPPGIGGLKAQQAEAAEGLTKSPDALLNSVAANYAEQTAAAAATLTNVQRSAKLSTSITKPC